MLLKNPKKKVGATYELVNLRYYRWQSYNKKCLKVRQKLGTRKIQKIKIKNLKI